MSALSTNPSQGPCWWELWWRWRCSLPPWLSLSPSLTELTAIHPVDDEHWHNGRCSAKIWEVWSGPRPRRLPPTTRWVISTDSWQSCFYFPIFLNWIYSPESQGISICTIWAHQLTLHWLWVDSHSLSGYIVDNMYPTSRSLSSPRC